MDKVIKKNILALLLYQGSALLIPLITLPYLARVLGVIEFGRLGLCVAIIQYFVLLVDYGFNLCITARIARIASYQSDYQQLVKIFFTTFYAKAVLMLVGLFVLCLCLFIPIIRNNIELILCCYLMVIGNFLFPSWFLQGLEKMDIISNSNLFARFLAVPLIFLFIHNSSDVFKVALIQGTISILASLLALVKIYQLKIVSTIYFPSVNEIKEYLAESWHYFISISSVSLYTNTNVLILGLVANSTSVGYFIGVDKVKGAMLSVLNPFTQAIYPRVNKLMQEDEEQAFIFIARYLVVFGFGSLIYSVLIFLLSPLVIQVLLGKDFLPAVKDLQILAFLPFIIILNNFFGTQLMLPKGKKKSFMWIISGGGVLNIILLSLLGSKYKDFGACLSIFITELFITLLMIIYTYIKMPNFFYILTNKHLKKL